MMRTTNIRRFLTMTVAGAIAAHIAVTCAVSIVLAAVYTHRIPDVTRWRGAPIDGFRFIGSFLDERAARKKLPVLVFAGSSFTYGYPWQESVIFSRVFSRERPDLSVVNPSLLSGDVSSVNDWIVCGVKRAGLHLDVIVLEIPVVNSVSGLAAMRRAGHPGRRLARCDTRERTPGFVQFAMSHAQGLGWLPFLWDNEAYPKTDEIVSINAVPAGYFIGTAEFEAVQAVFESEIVELLRNAKSVAPVVIAYPSPVFVAGLREVGADHQAMQYQMNFARAACAKVSGVHCLDPAQRFATRDMYSNLTHFNQRGHRALGEWLAREVVPR